MGGVGGEMGAVATRSCPICGGQYHWHPFYVGDQSACPACVGERERRASRPTPEEVEEQRRRREAYFNGR